MDKFKFTQKGLEYIAQAADGCTVVFTKGKYGDGSPPIDVLSLTDLVNAKGDLTIASKTVDGNQVTIKTSFTNVQSDGTIAESFYLREMGLFGKLLNSSGDVQGEETLLIYACATGSDSGDYISQNSPTEFVINFSFAVSDSGNLTLSVDLDAYALKSDMEAVESEISDLQNGTGLNDGAVTTDKLANGAVTSDKIDIAVTDSLNYYGVCDTARTESTKTVTINNLGELTDGMRITVKFTNGLTVYSAKGLQIKINDFDALDVRHNGVDGVAGYGKDEAYTDFGGTISFIYCKNGNDEYLNIDAPEIVDSAWSVLNEITEGDITDGAVTTDKIEDGAITINKLADGLKTYSTTPQKVGYWIDGTPIWRVAFDTTYTDEEVETLKTGTVPYAALVALVTFKNSTSSIFILNAYGCLRLADSPCVVDDSVLLFSGNHDFYISDSDKDRVTNGVGNGSNVSYFKGIYGWYEFATPESNISTT